MPNNALMKRPEPIGVTTTPLGDQVVTKKAKETRPRYDHFLLTTPLAAIPNPIPFFVVPIGGAGSGFPIKTEVHTNASLSRQLEKGVAINIVAIELALIPFGTARNGDVVMQTIAALWEDSYIRFRINDTVILEARSKEFTDGSGLTGIAPMTSPAPRTFVSVAPTVRGVRKLRRPAALAAREMIDFELFWNENNAFLAQGLSAGDDILLGATIFGKTSRPLD